MPEDRLLGKSQDTEALQPLDPEEVGEAVRASIPMSSFERALDESRGFHSYYEGTLTNIALTRLTK